MREAVGGTDMVATVYESVIRRIDDDRSGMVLWMTVSFHFHGRRLYLCTLLMSKSKFNKIAINNWFF
jgi:hypothetical protein